MQGSGKQRLNLTPRGGLRSQIAKNTKNRTGIGITIAEKGRPALESPWDR